MKKFLLLTLLVGTQIHPMNGEHLHHLKEGFAQLWNWLKKSRTAQSIPENSPLLDRLPPEHRVASERSWWRDLLCAYCREVCCGCGKIDKQ